MSTNKNENELVKVFGPIGCTFGKDEYGREYIIYKGVSMFALKSYNEKAYHFRLLNDISKELIELTGVDCSNVERSIPIFVSQPNKVGVPTEKKMDDWVNYLVTCKHKAQKLAEARASEIMEQEKKYKEIFGEDIVFKPCSNSPGLSGTVKRDGITFDVEIYCNGECCEHISIDLYNKQSAAVFTKFIMDNAPKLEYKTINYDYNINNFHEAQVNGVAKTNKGILVVA